MFQFPGLPCLAASPVFNQGGYPIRTSRNQQSFALPPGFSQLTTSFIVSESLGIPRTPFVYFLVFTYLSQALSRREGEISRYFLDRNESNRNVKSLPKTNE